MDILQRIHVSRTVSLRNTASTHCVSRAIRKRHRLASGSIKRKVRCHNRQIHKMTILKGGVRKRNQAPYEVKGFRLFDKVRYDGREYFIFGRRSSGFFDIRTLDGKKINNGSISYKKLALLETGKHYLTERRIGSPLTTKVTSVRT